VPKPDLEPFGERAVRVVLEPAWAEDLGGRAALSKALLEVPGVRDALVGETHALLVLSDSPSDELAPAISAALARSRGAPAPRGAVREVDVVYDGADLEEVARTIGASPKRVIALHTERPHHVSFLGFLPGFAYLRGLEPQLAAIPRRVSPRPRVPAGSVAIAGGMSAIYPSASPGGWNLLGRTTFDVLGAPLVPGDIVRFRESEDGEAASTSAIELPPTVGLCFERVAGIALIVDGAPRRVLRDGAPPGGPLVPTLARRALASAGCAEGEALVERYGALTVSLSGDLERTIADETGRAFTVRAGQRLELPWSGRDRVGYLAVAGGLDTPRVLGGRGTLLSIGRGGLRGRPLRRGDVVALGEPSSDPTEPPTMTDLHREGVIVAQRGPDLLDVEHASRALAGASFRVAHASDRTGTRLVAEPAVSLRTRPARSAPVIRGAIQAPPSGELVILGPDHPITGGYPVVAVLPAAATEAVFARPIGARVRLRIV